MVSSVTLDIGKASVHLENISVAIRMKRHRSRIGAHQIYCHAVPRRVELPSFKTIAASQFPHAFAGGRFSLS
jgi:hypothetical protein